MFDNLQKQQLWNRLIPRLKLLLPVRTQAYIKNIQSPEPQVTNILCMPAAGIGDFVMVTPAIAALKKRFPQASITVLCHYNRGVHQICELMPTVDATIDIGLDDYTWPSVIRFFLGGFWRLLRVIRKKRFDFVVAFIPNIIRRLLLMGLNCNFYTYGNTIRGYPGTIAFELLKPLGIKNYPIENVFEVPKPQNAASLLPANLKKPLIGMHPFCGLEWRQWIKFGKLERKLAGLPASLVIVGQGKNYNPLSSSRNLINKLSLTELFWVIKQCAVFVTADSGPMHIAFATGTPTVALFGPVKPELRIPPSAGKTRNKIIYKKSVQSEKIRRITQRKKIDNSQMQQISVDEVVDAVKSILDFGSKT